MKQSTAQSRKRRQRKAAAGECIDCTAPRQSGHVRCDACHALMAARTARTTNAYRIRRCPSCGTDVQGAECWSCGYVSGYTVEQNPDWIGLGDEA